MTLFDRYTSFVGDTVAKAWDFASPFTTSAWDAWQSWCGDLGGRLDQPWQVVMAATVVAVLILWRIIGEYVVNFVLVVLLLGLVALVVTAVVMVLSVIGAWINAHPLLTAAGLFLGMVGGILAWVMWESEDPWEDVLVPAGEVAAMAGLGLWAAAQTIAGKIAGLVTRNDAASPEAAEDGEAAAEVAMLHELFEKPPHRS